MAVVTEQSTALYSECHKYSHHYGNSVRLESDLCDLNMTSESVREEIEELNDRQEDKEKVVDEQRLYKRKI